MRTVSPFPVHYSILAAKALADEVAGAYGLAPPVTCQLLRPGLNDTYLVAAGHEKYILRVYRMEWRTASEVAYELDLLHHLAGRGTVVAEPIRAQDGGLALPLDAPEGTRQLVLFAYASGRPLSWEHEGDSYLMGRVAASIHAAAHDFASPHERFKLDLEYLVDAPLAAIAPFLADRPSELAELERFAAGVRRRAVFAEPGLDWGICHGDLAAKHVHVDGDGTATVFDFDLCGAGWRAYDLAAAPYYATYKHARSSWEAFLSGYLDVRRIGDGDLAALPLFHAINRLWSLGLYARNAERWGSLPMRQAYVATNLAFFRQWDQEHAHGA